MNCDTMDDIKSLASVTQAGTCLTTKQNSVVAVGEVGNGGNIAPVLSQSSCCKSEWEQFLEMITTIFENVQCDVIATDGDAMRRKTFTKISEQIKDTHAKGILERLFISI